MRPTPYTLHRHRNTEQIVTMSVPIRLIIAVAFAARPRALFLIHLTYCAHSPALHNAKTYAALVASITLKVSRKQLILNEDSHSALI
jgi:hypothetical protein